MNISVSGTTLAGKSSEKLKKTFVIFRYFGDKSTDLYDFFRDAFYQQKHVFQQLNNFVEDMANFKNIEKKGYEVMRTTWYKQTR